MSNQKNPGVAAVLGFLFGGFGLFYVSVGQGIAALAVLILGSLVTGGVAAPILWIGCAIWGYVAANNYNEQNSLYLEQETEREAYYSDMVNQRPNSSQRAPSQQSNNDWNQQQQPDQNQPPRGRFCGQCGTELRPNVKFCTSCGAEA